MRFFYLKKLWGDVKQHGGLTRGADVVLELGRRADQEKVVNPSSLAASRILGWQ